MIVIEPSHGLCNRLRAIKSAMNLAKKYNQKLVVLWRVDNDLTCRFFDLFSLIFQHFPQSVSKKEHIVNFLRSGNGAFKQQKNTVQSLPFARCFFKVKS